MENWKKFPRVVLFLSVLISMVAGVSLPVQEEQSVRAAPMQANALDVIISEVAWGGTSSSYTTDEWIELFNTTNSFIDLSGWTLSADDGDPNISLTGGIPANGYYLLESIDDNTLSDIVADQTYSGTLGNSAGEILRLRDNLTNEIDSANSNGDTWDAGTAGTGTPTYASMERNGNTPDGNAGAWFSNNGIIRNGLAADGNPINGTPRNSQIDLSLTMTVLPAAPNVGDSITFTVSLTNQGIYSATNISVRDVLPTAGLTGYSISATDGSYNNATSLWSIPSLVSGSTATLSITANITTAGLKTNQAEIWNFDQFDPDSTPGNGITTEDDFASAQVSTPGATTLNITNTVNNPNPSVGSNVVFTITVSNPSSNPDEATGVQVSAPIPVLPAGLTYISYSASVGTYNGTNWIIGNLAIGSSATLNVTARVVATNPPPYSSTVSSNEYLPATATATIFNPLSGEANLSLAHVPPDPPNTSLIKVNAAGQVTFKLRLLNAGPDKATNVQVRDLLPSGLDYVSYTSSAGTYNSGTGIWVISELVSGGEATLSITVKVQADGDGTKNFAEVWRSDQYDPNSTTGNGDRGEDDGDSLEVPIADLNLSQTVSVAGGNAVFRITVRNDGPDDASNITVKNSKLALPVNYVYVSHGSTAGTYTMGTGDWTIPSLLDGASATLTVTTTFTSLSVNWAQVSGVNEVDPDSLPANCYGTITQCTEDDDASAPAADLSVTQTVNNGNPNIGDNVVFWITVRNAGLANTSGVQVKSLLPSGLTYVSDSIGNDYNRYSGIWRVGDLPNGTSKTMTITATVASTGIKTNVAEVWKSDQDDPDSTPANRSASEDDYAAAAVTPFRSVVINEVAWGGTAASPEDEWIELYNPSSVDITLTGWKIKKNGCTSPSSYDYIALASGTRIAKGGFFLLERGSTPGDNTTVSDVSADQIYLDTIPALLDSGEILYLCSNQSYFLDSANKDGGAWPAGSADSRSNRGSMERLNILIDSDNTWATNVGTPRNGLDANGDPIYGTPKRGNSAGLVPTATPVSPIPTAAALIRPVINEFLARPGFDWNQDGRVDVFDEFIEIKNISIVDVNLNGWKLDDEADSGSTPYVLPNLTLKPGERAIFYGLQTNILLGDGGDTVRLINPNGKIYDAYTYAIAKVEDQSVCRLPDGNGSWYEDCVPTPNLINSREGEVPTMPGGEAFESPVCDLPDTLPADFLFAECRGYGADIWRSFFWDQFGWQGDRSVYQNMSKWEAFVE
ncbi:hypothetical protein ANAEL_03163 [Anaerolineales bacterium]|nr:hypothetical protein ANAEL_03163 [Anaerolineales bacterium]